MEEATTTTPRKESFRTATVIAGTAVFANGLFSLFAHFYYQDKAPLIAAGIGAMRFAFATLTLAVAAMAYVAAVAPRLIGHAVGGALSIAAFCAAIGAISKGMPPVMGATLLLVGALVPVLVWMSLARSRSAWAFLVSILVVFAVVTFFGAPKIRNLLGINLWYAMIVPGLLTVGTIALSMVRGEYRA